MNQNVAEKSVFLSDCIPELCVPPSSFVLPAGLTRELVEQGLLGSGHSSRPDPASCFHGAPYGETLLRALGGSELREMRCSRVYKV